MTRVLLSAAVLALSILPANAVCNTAALNGTWYVKAEANTDGCIAKVRSGKISGACGSGSISLSATCAISGVIQGATFKGRTESVAGTSAKPNLLVGSGSDIGGLIGYRQ